MNQDNQKRKPAPKSKGNKSYRNNTTNNKNRRNGTFNNRKQKNHNRTLLVSQLNLDDFNHDNRNLAEHYREQRVNMVVELFEEFGEIESIEKHLAQNMLLVTFSDNKSAFKALKTLSKKPELASRINQMRDQLAARGKPEGLAPNNRLNIMWSDRPAQKVHTVKAANIVEDDVNTAPQEKPKKVESKPKKGKSQKQKTKQKNEAQEMQINGQSTTQPPIDGVKLRREAELLRLNNYLENIQHDKASLANDLKAHTARFESRQQQIETLTKELKRLESEIESVRGMLGRQQTRQQETDTFIAQLKKQLQQAEEEEQSVTEQIASASVEQ